MYLVQVTPGAGGMYCGNCLRDNALVAAWRQLGHRALMVPLYLPLSLDEPDQSQATPIFFSGVNVYLDQHLPFFRRAPGWLRRRLASTRLLRWAGRFAGKTRASEVAELTLSMLRGEHGHQARDLAELTSWLRSQGPPDLLLLSNALLLGMARQLKTELAAPVACFLAGEDAFVDGMAEPLRTQVWTTLAERARDIDCFLAPSRYFADRMRERLALRPDQIRVVPTGLNLDGYPPPDPQPRPKSPNAAAAGPAPIRLGFFARMCPDKGLDLVVDAFLRLRRNGQHSHLRLQIGGSCGPADEPFVAGLRERIAAAGLGADVTFHPNLDREGKIGFLRSLGLFVVPARYGEAFGLYLLEALACGVPVVQPRVAGFPEVVEGTQGGVLYEPNTAEALAEAIRDLLSDDDRRQALGAQGQRVVHQQHAIQRVADSLAKELAGMRRPNAAG